MTYFVYFRALSWPQQRLLLEAFIWLGLARLAVLTLPFRTILYGLGQSHDTHHSLHSPLDPLQFPQIQQVAWAIRVISQRTPWQSNCLAQALAGLIMLRRRKIASTLYVGVTKKEDTMTAHAWLQCAETIVTGGHQVDSFRMIAKFSSKSST